MTFYIGSSQELPSIPFDKNSPAFNTTSLNEDEEAIYKHISLANVVNFGSDQGCGCGFRHALLDNGNWLYVEVEDESPAEREAIQKNHEELYRYIKASVSDKTPIEIYGCWNGDFDEVAASVEEIMIDDLIDKNFYFKERGFYTLNHGG
jgi:hypothetical protein